MSIGSCARPCFFLQGYRLVLDAEFEKNSKEILVEHTLGIAGLGFEGWRNT